MTTVAIAELKNKLSEKLRYVRKGGEIIVTDRDVPIAKISPYKEEDIDIKITHPAKKPSDIKKLKFKPITCNVDVVALLREDRDRR